MKDSSIRRFTLVPSAISFFLGAVLAWPLARLYTGGVSDWIAKIDWPAWVQAVGSVLAILVAIALPHWLESRQSKARARDLLELLTYALAVLELGKKEFKDPQAESSEWIITSIDLVSASIRSVKYLDNPHPVIAMSLQQADVALATVAKYLWHQREQIFKPNQQELNNVFDRHSRVIVLAIAACRQATGVSPRKIAPPPTLP